MRKIKIIPSIKSKPKIKMESKDYAYSEHLAAVNFDKIPYCQNPDLGIDAPDCSEECCKFDSCAMEGRRNYKFPDEENSKIFHESNSVVGNCSHVEGLHTCYYCKKLITDKSYLYEDNGVTYSVCSKCNKNHKLYLAASENNSNDLNINININDNIYTFKEIVEILKKHQEEEDKKLNICYICGDKYLENKKFNMVNEKMEEDKDLKPGTAIGYQIPPIITGIQIQSTCGNGKKIKLCDNCIQKLLALLKGDK